MPIWEIADLGVLGVMVLIFLIRIGFIEVIFDILFAVIGSDSGSGSSGGGGFGGGDSGGGGASGDF